MHWPLALTASPPHERRVKDIALMRVQSEEEALEVIVTGMKTIYKVYQLKKEKKKR